MEQAKINYMPALGQAQLQSVHFTSAETEAWKVEVAAKMVTQTVKSRTKICPKV